jgi:hypothetical protein
MRKKTRRKIDSKEKRIRKITNINRSFATRDGKNVYGKRGKVINTV